MDWLFSFGAEGGYAPAAESGRGQLVMGVGALLVFVLVASALAPDACRRLCARVWARLTLRSEAEWRLRRAWRALETTLPDELAEQLSGVPEDQLREALFNALEPLLPAGNARPELHLAVDIGGTRTKFMLQRGGSETLMLEPVLSQQLWQDHTLPTEDKFDPDAVPSRMRAHLEACGVPLADVQRVVFSVPGTVDIGEEMAQPSELVLVRNMPSFSPKFRGFNFKARFGPVFPNAKISAVPDNMAAALGVACTAPRLQNALVLVLGTAPAVATFFRDPSKGHKYIESAIWQSWVWFTKIDLHDPHGYCQGVHLGDDGRTLQLRAASAYKIPHHQARIRFALDRRTWERLLGRDPLVPTELQGHLSEADATRVWCERLRSALAALALKFHSVYGPPEMIYVLGGNATRCHGHVQSTAYEIPDSAKRFTHTVPVVIPPTDMAQQRVSLSGLLFSARFKVQGARPRSARRGVGRGARRTGAHAAEARALARAPRAAAAAAGEARLRAGTGPARARLDARRRAVHVGVPAEQGRRGGRALALAHALADARGRRGGDRVDQAAGGARAQRAPLRHAAAAPAAHAVQQRDDGRRGGGRRSQAAWRRRAHRAAHAVKGHRRQRQRGWLAQAAAQAVEQRGGRSQRKRLAQAAAHVFERLSGRR